MGNLVLVIVISLPIFGQSVGNIIRIRIYWHLTHVPIFRLIWQNVANWSVPSRCLCTKWWRANLIVFQSEKPGLSVHVTGCTKKIINQGANWLLVPAILLCSAQVRKWWAIRGTMGHPQWPIKEKSDPPGHPGLEQVVQSISPNVNKLEAPSFCLPDTCWKVLKIWLLSLKCYTFTRIIKDVQWYKNIYVH